VKYVRDGKTRNFAENFGSGIARFGLIRILGPFPCEHISSVESGMGLGHSVSGLGSVLPGLVRPFEKSYNSVFRLFSQTTPDLELLKLSEIFFDFHATLLM